RDHRFGDRHSQCTLRADLESGASLLERESHQLEGFEIERPSLQVGRNGHEKRAGGACPTVPRSKGAAMCDPRLITPARYRDGGYRLVRPGMRPTPPPPPPPPPLGVAPFTHPPHGPTTPSHAADA